MPSSPCYSVLINSVLPLLPAQYDFSVKFRLLCGSTHHTEAVTIQPMKQERTIHCEGSPLYPRHRSRTLWPLFLPISKKKTDARIRSLFGFC